MHIAEKTEERFVRSLLGPRPKEMHKGNCGRVLIAAGSAGMAGAAVLCAQAALRSGAGLVTIAAPQELYPILQTAVPEATCIDVRKLREADLDRFDAIAVGPGIGVSEERYHQVGHILERFRGPVILDADGINSLCRFADGPDLLRKWTQNRAAPVIMTPHPGEADRLLAWMRAQSCSRLGREQAAEILAENTGAVIVLKGARTLVAVPHVSGDKNSITNIYVNNTGNPGMATGGSGDVLSGCMAALTAFGSACRSAGLAGFSPEDAARCAVYVHGLAGDIAAKRLGEIGMTAMDIVRSLPPAFLKLAGNESVNQVE